MTTAKQQRAAKLVSENIRSETPRPIGAVLQEAGYSRSVSESPTLVTESPTFQDLLNQYLPDDKLTKTHTRLLETRKLEHMVFPLGPSGEDDVNLSGATPNRSTETERAGVEVERTTLTDQEIKDMLLDVNCLVKRIVHGESARHVYYWSHDANAQSKALELAYKMKGHMNAKGEGGNTFNFINNANFSSKKYVK